MPDFLDVLAADARATVGSGYYISPKEPKTVHASLKQTITRALGEGRNPVIAEVKAASPSAGTIRAHFAPDEIAKAMENGGAIGISVLTEPKHFGGSLRNLSLVREAVNLPILMKDIVITPFQLSVASWMGANVVLLIQALFDRGYCNQPLSQMIADAHARGLEVLLETHNENEFRHAVQMDADLVGINNRNLGTLKVDLEVTQNVLKNNQTKGKLIVSESGIKTPADLQFVKKAGAQAFLIGSSVMLANDVEGKVKELVNA